MGKPSTWAVVRIFNADRVLKYAFVRDGERWKLIAGIFYFQGTFISKAKIVANDESDTLIDPHWFDGKTVTLRFLVPPTETDET